MLIDHVRAFLQEENQLYEESRSDGWSFFLKSPVFSGKNSNRILRIKLISGTNLRLKKSVSSRFLPHTKEVLFKESIPETKLRCIVDEELRLLHERFT